jgi:hypothetical protein
MIFCDNEMLKCPVGALLGGILKFEVGSSKRGGQTKLICGISIFWIKENRCVDNSMISIRENDLCLF